MSVTATDGIDRNDLRYTGVDPVTSESMSTDVNILQHWIMVVDKEVSISLIKVSGLC